ncbi:hypothetical protein KR044_013449 [Drosophila immigrans]|nr:hypothetical protein KR044_013449 [Drosophila immigrans]
MSSGRSARLPPTPTPTQNANNKHHRVAGGEPNSNNMMQYSSSNNSSATTGTTANGSAASNAATTVGGLQMGSLGMNLSMNSMGGMTTTSGGVAGYGLGSLSGGVSISTSDAATESIPGETIDVLGPELAVATSQVLENLSENERKMIIEVLNRDESVRQRDATRIM